ncbi:hypothetical protein CXP39_03625 [Mesoplasma syrphidae]|uniref:Uncharacterized protein n=1 Tax=Mesoplasma syrphidae TaxID=225999 RepID=A0A2K9CDX6_9MOLU|nr:hypothetical protein [Mesoplasma syrphidae]AUF83854.1 hypothetical protein CXP39_03625 [Mesoplasma syrphidae]
MKKKSIISCLTVGFLCLASIPIYSSIDIIRKSLAIRKGPKSTQALENLLNFKDIPLIPEFRRSWEKLLDDSSSFSSAYDWSYKWQMEGYMKDILSEKPAAIDIDMNKMKPISHKSKLTDAIYLGLQTFGYGKPTVSELNEIERYEIANFEELEKQGYKMYVRKKDDKQDLIQITNIIENSIYKDVDESGKENIFYQVDNSNKTSNIFFKTTSKINKNTIKDYQGTSINLEFKAVKKDDNENKVLNIYDPYYNRKSLEILVDYHNSENFINFRMWDWNQYNSDTTNLQCYIANNLIKIYCEIALNYINYIDPNSEMYKVKAPPLEGVKTPFNYNGSNPASTLYYAYKYNAYFDLRIFVFTDQNNLKRTSYISYDQNNIIEFEKNDDGKDVNKFDKDLHQTKNDIKNRERLPFNPWIDFNNTMRNFVDKTWNLLMFAMDEMS